MLAPFRFLPLVAEMLGLEVEVEAYEDRAFVIACRNEIAERFLGERVFKHRFLSTVDKQEYCIVVVAIALGCSNYRQGRIVLKSKFVVVLRAIDFYGAIEIVFRHIVDSRYLWACCHNSIRIVLLGLVTDAASESYYCYGDADYDSCFSHVLYDL